MLVSGRVYNKHSHQWSGCCLSNDWGPQGLNIVWLIWYDQTKTAVFSENWCPNFWSQLSMFNLGVYKKVLHFKTFLTRQKSSEVGYASSHFSSAGPHNLYVVGKVHGVHFRTATRFFGCSKIWEHWAWFKRQLGGGFKYFSFSPLFGEDSHFD